MIPRTQMFTILAASLLLISPARSAPAPDSGGGLFGGDGGMDLKTMNDNIFTTGKPGVPGYWNVKIGEENVVLNYDSLFFNGATKILDLKSDSKIPVHIIFPAQNFEAYCKHLVYDVEREIYTLTGQARVVQTGEGDGMTMTGDIITITQIAPDERRVEIRRTPSLPASQRSRLITAAPGDNAAKNMDLQGEHITFTQRGGELLSLTARGSVVMISENFELLSDKMVYDPLADKMVATVSKSKEVKIISDGSEAYCKRLDYFLGDGKYELRENVRIKRPGSDMSGEHFVITPTKDGGTQLIDNSTVSESKAGPLTALQRIIALNIEKMERAFPLRDGDANRLIRGRNMPAEVVIDTLKKPQKNDTRRTGPSSGVIAAGSLDNIPDRSDSRRLEIEE